MKFQHFGFFTAVLLVYIYPTYHKNSMAIYNYCYGYCSNFQRCVSCGPIDWLRFPEVCSKINNLKRCSAPFP